MRIYLFGLIILFTAIACAQNLADEFDSTRARSSAQIAPDSLQDGLFESYADAVGNWTELHDFIASYSGERLSDGIWLINTMPHLDRLLATSAVLKEHLDYAYRVRDEAPWPVPDSMFRAYILAYRISYEPVNPWRKLFYEEFFPAAKKEGNIRKATSYVNRWVSENIDTASYEFFGGMQSPDLTYNRCRGTRGEISALTTAILKALGIASRNAMIRTIRGEGVGMSWVEVFDAENGEWIPLYPDSPEKFGNKEYPIEKYPDGVTVVTTIGGFDMEFSTSEYVETGYLKAFFTKADQPAVKWGHFSVCVFGNGAYWPLDELGAETDSTGYFEAELGVGEYIIQCGMRDRTGSVWVQTIPFSIDEGDTTRVKTSVDAPQYLGTEMVEPGRFPVFTLSDFSGNPFSHNQIKGKKPLVLFFFEDGAEPSERAIPMIEKVLEDWADSVRFISVMVNPANSGVEIPEIEGRVLVDSGGELALALTDAESITELENNNLPLILFCAGKDLTYKIVSKGYNTDLENLLRTEIEFWSED